MAVAVDHAALVTMLRPWICALALHNAHCALKDLARVERGVRFFFFVPLRELEQTDGAVTTLREAIDLVYRVLALDTALALTFKDSQNDSDLLVRGCEDPSVKRALLRDAPFEFEIAMDVRLDKDARIVKHVIADEFLLKLSQTPSSSTAYLAARATLDKLLDATKPQWTDALAHTPIRVKCWLHTAYRPDMSDEQFTDLVPQLVTLANALDPFDGTATVASGHLPLCVDVEGLSLSCIPITSHGVLAIKERIASNPRVSLLFRFLTINPRLVDCSREDIGVFVRAMARNDVGFNTQPFQRLQDMVPVDSEVDAACFLRDLLIPIVACEGEHRTCLSIGGLLKRYRSFSNRAALYQVVIDYVFTRPTPMSLHLGYAEVHEGDASLFTALVQDQKTQNPQVKLRVQHLTVDLYDANFVFTNACIAALDEVKELSIASYDVDAPPISNDLVVTGLEKFRTLQRISLTNVHLNSLQTFLDKSPPTLEAISLSALRLDDRKSFLEFAEALGHQEQPLARQLRHLTISECEILRSTGQFRLDEQDLVMLADAMRSNRSLERLSVRLQEADPLRRDAQIFRLRHAGSSILPAPKEVSRSCEEKARRVAFLSVLQDEKFTSMKSALDTFLVRQIFDLSGPWVSRTIDVS